MDVFANRLNPYRQLRGEERPRNWHAHCSVLTAQRVSSVPPATTFSRTRSILDTSPLVLRVYPPHIPRVLRRKVVLHIQSNPTYPMASMDTDELPVVLPSTTTSGLSLALYVYTIREVNLRVSIKH